MRSAGPGPVISPAIPEIDEPSSALRNPLRLRLPGSGERRNWPGRRSPAPRLPRGHSMKRTRSVAYGMGPPSAGRAEGKVSLSPYQATEPRRGAVKSSPNQEPDVGLGWAGSKAACRYL